MTRVDALLEAVRREVEHRRPEILAHPEEAASFQVTVRFAPHSAAPLRVLWSKQAERRGGST